MDEEYLNYGLGEQPAGVEIQLPEQVQAVNPEDQQYYVGNKGGSSGRNPYLSKLYGNIGQKQYDTLTNRAKYIYKRFINAGLSPQQAAGILGNMWAESTLNPNLKHGQYTGIAQNDRDTWNDIVPIYGQSLDGQLNFIIDYATGKLNTTKKKSRSGQPYAYHIGYQSGKYVKGNHSTPEDSARDFAEYFERCKIRRNGKTLRYADGRPQLQALKKRQEAARAFYNAFVNQKFETGGKLKLILK